MTIITKEPARWPAIMPARLADLLQRSMPRWLLTEKLAETAKAALRIGADESTGERRPGTLPWWASHHPALSFRARRADRPDNG
ncbi:MAG: hypothetical protein ACKVOI_14560 [Dongiaceae bacterium]